MEVRAGERREEGSRHGLLQSLLAPADKGVGGAVDITIKVNRYFVQVKESGQLLGFKVRWALFRNFHEACRSSSNLKLWFVEVPSGLFLGFRST